ncbi:MAG: carboxypeptidase regulatory-like domain-containing protein [Bryobacterales bacterium]|nr:carboxypeptidase regulatory-like domain-containing protein [Bryobacterales bacterium]
MKLLAALFAAHSLLAQDVIEGTVVNSVTGTGLSGVIVTLAGRANRYDTSTSETGQFHLGSVQPGTYYATFQKTGYFPLNSNGIQAVEFGPGKDAQSLRIELAPAATLRGSVFDPDGKPVANAQVEARPDTGKVAITREDGSFQLDGLAPGAYTLVAWPPERKPAIGIDGTRTKLAATYYPSGIEASEAVKVSIRGGDNLSGFDFRLQNVQVYRVRGIALDESGRPAARIHVYLTRKQAQSRMTVFFAPGAGFHVSSPASNEQEASVTSDDKGNFEFPAVRPGDWALVAESGQNRYGLTDISVGRRDVDDLRVELASMLNLNATADWGEVPKENRRVAAMIVGEDALHKIYFASGEAGTLVFQEMRAGRYRIFAGSTGAAYVSSVMLGSMDVTGQVVDLSMVSPPLQIVLKPNAGFIRGTVREANGATVMIVPQTFDASGGAEMIRLAKCAADGAFEIGGLPPGSYYAVATMAAPESVPLESVVSSATSVRVEEGSTATLELRLVP